MWVNYRTEITPVCGHGQALSWKLRTQFAAPYRGRRRRCPTTGGPLRWLRATTASTYARASKPSGAYRSARPHSVWPLRTMTARGAPGFDAGAVPPPRRVRITIATHINASAARRRTTADLRRRTRPASALRRRTGGTLVRHGARRAFSRTGSGRIALCALVTGPPFVVYLSGTTLETRCDRFQTGLFKHMFGS
jgi:hypothetical protein